MSIRLSVILFGAAALIPFMTQANVGVISQEDVDRIVDTEILMYEHDEDFQAAEKSLVDKGVTRAMLAQGYYSSMIKAMNAERGTSECEKFQAAAYGFRCAATDVQLTNLLHIAEVATNALSVSEVVEVYHARAPLSSELINWCTNRVAKGQCPDLVKSTIWNCLEQSMAMKEISVDAKNAVLGCSLASLYKDPQSVFRADKILSQYDPEYKTSQLRKRVLARIGTLKDAEMSEVARRYFGVVTKEVEGK